MESKFIELLPLAELFDFEEELIEAFDYILEQNQLIPQKKQQLRSKNGRFDINIISDDEFRKRFRFTKVDTMRLLRCFGIPDIIETKQNYKTTGKIYNIIYMCTIYIKS